MSVDREYSKQELAKLHQSARHLLGWELVLHDLHVPENAAAGLRERLLDTRRRAVIAVSEIDFYPTQSKTWQAKIDRGEGERGPMQVYSDFANANPLVSVVLQRGPKAKSDPLAVIKRVMAATSKTRAGETTWKKLLTDLGVPNEQLLQVMQAMNYANVLDADSPVQLRKLQGVSFDNAEEEPSDGAHADLQSKLVLTADAKSVLKSAVLQLFKERNP